MARIDVQHDLSDLAAEVQGVVSTLEVAPQFGARLCKQRRTHFLLGLRQFDQPREFLRSAKLDSAVHRLPYGRLAPETRSPLHLPVFGYVVHPCPEDLEATLVCLKLVQRAPPARRPVGAVNEFVLAKLFEGAVCRGGMKACAREALAEDRAGGLRAETRLFDD